MSPPKASTCKHSHVAFAHLWFNDITLHDYEFLNADLGHNVILLELTTTNITYDNKGSVEQVIKVHYYIK